MEQMSGDAMLAHMCVSVIVVSSKYQASGNTPWRAGALLYNDVVCLEISSPNQMTHNFCWCCRL